MYIYICMYINMCVYICVCVCTYVYIYIYIYVCVYSETVNTLGPGQNIYFRGCSHFGQSGFFW